MTTRTRLGRVLAAVTAALFGGHFDDQATGQVWQAAGVNGNATTGARAHDPYGDETTFRCTNHGPIAIDPASLGVDSLSIADFPNNPGQFYFSLTSADVELEVEGLNTKTLTIRWDVGVDMRMEMERCFPGDVALDYLNNALADLGAMLSFSVDPMPPGPVEVHWEVSAHSNNSSKKEFPTAPPSFCTPTPPTCIGLGMPCIDPAACALPIVDPNMGVDDPSAVATTLTLNGNPLAPTADFFDFDLDETGIKWPAPRQGMIVLQPTDTADVVINGNVQSAFSRPGRCLLTFGLAEYWHEAAHARFAGELILTIGGPAVPPVPPPGCCPGTGDCFEINGTPGCSDPLCCDLVSQQDPFCCVFDWDALCVLQALQVCVPPNNSNCPMPGPCLAPHPGMGCDNPLCCDLVCAFDPLCCSSEWDVNCAQLASFISACQPPPCMPGSIVEAEPDCGLPSDTYNGGCNLGNPTFTPIACGDTICGTAAFDTMMPMRDTDWYQLTVPAPTVLDIEVTAPFKPQVALIDTMGLPSCPNPLGALFNLEGPANQTFTISQPIPAGTWYLFLSPSNTNGRIPCPAHYTVSLNCCSCGPADLNIDCKVDLLDLLILLNNWGSSGPGAGLASPSNNVDVADLLVLLNNWGPCP